MENGGGGDTDVAAITNVTRSGAFPGLVLSTAFMMWKGLSVVSDSPSPIVVVLSGSMEPAFQRGDLLFLWNRNLIQDTDVGEIVVYNVRGKDIPIVHRVVRKFGTGYVQGLGEPSGRNERVSILTVVPFTLESTPNY